MHKSSIVFQFDSLEPALDTFESKLITLPAGEAFKLAVISAEEGAEGTKNLTARYLNKIPQIWGKVYDMSLCEQWQLLY